MFHDLDIPSQRALDPLVEAFLLVAAIGPNQLETRKDPGERRKQAFAAAVVLDVGLMDEHMQDQPIRIDQQVALAAFDFFPAIVATNPSLLGRLHRLTVDDGRAGSRLAPLFQAYPFA